MTVAQAASFQRRFKGVLNVDGKKMQLILSYTGAINADNNPIKLLTGKEVTQRLRIGTTTIAGSYSQAELPFYLIFFPIANI